MLKSWSIENFKAIVNSGELKLAPVTVLAGLNSSGKSSLLQSILMIAQTLSSRLLDRALLPNERIVQLGTFEDVLNEWSGSRKLTVGFELEINEAISMTSDLEAGYVKVITTFNSIDDIKTATPTIGASNVVVESVLLEVDADVSYFAWEKAHEHLNSGYEKKGKSFVSISTRRLTDTEPKQNANEQSNYLGELSCIGKIQKPSELYSVKLSHFLPVSFSISPNERGVSNLELNLSLVNLIEESVEIIARFFASKIRYLGPLRADPQASQQYPVSSELDDVGPKGEYAGAVYEVNQNARIEWYNPSSQQIEQSTLREALDSWVRYLGVANQIMTRTAGYRGFSWQVVHKQGHKPLPLSAVGVGVSQILPILVMGLLSPRGTLLIIEQPELHLHPRVQALLGDFFVGLSKCNKQCLIETHSENLVNQLRYHIVQAGGQEKSDCMIYFVNQDEKGAATFEQVKISERGNIVNWPSGFFDETMHQEDRITAASIRRRAKTAKKHD